MFFDHKEIIVNEQIIYIVPYIQLYMLNVVSELMKNGSYHTILN